MHKMIHSSDRIIGRKFNRAIFALNVPSMTAAVILAAVSMIVIRNMHVAPELYKIFFGVLYVTAAYSFAVTLVSSAIADRRIRGHKKYTYIEILGEEMVVSEYMDSAYENGRICDYRRMWVVALSDVEQVTCTRSKIIIKAKARKFEQRADWLDYSADEFGRVNFDYWWYNGGGGENIQSVEFKDNYTYAERIAQRIIFCSEKQKAREIKREEFRRRMLEIAGRKPGERRRKKKERVFRGYEIERKF